MFTTPFPTDMNSLAMFSAGFAGLNGIGTFQGSAYKEMEESKGKFRDWELGRNNMIVGMWDRPRLHELED